MGILDDHEPRLPIGLEEMEEELIGVALPYRTGHLRRHLRRVGADALRDDSVISRAYHDGAARRQPVQAAYHPR